MDDLGPWRLSLGRGETTFLDLAERDDFYDVLAALREMPEAGMKCSCWSASTPGMRATPPAAE